MFFITFVIGTAGNTFVLIVEAEKRQRSVDDIFIINLAVSDLLFLILYLPGRIYWITGGSPHSFLHCVFLRPSVTAVFQSSVFTITSMAIYRSKVIRNPFKPRMKHRYAYIWITVIWILSYIVALPAILVAKVHKSGWCGGDWPTPKHKEAYILGLLVMKCLLPLFVIIMAYIRIGLYVKDTRLPQSSARPSNIIRENIRIIKTLSVMVLLFAICTAPQQIAWMIKIIFRDTPTAQIIFKFSPSLNHFHSCVNPVIYGALKRSFLRGYLKYLAYIFCCFRALACYRNAMNEVSSVASERNINQRLSVDQARSQRPSFVYDQRNRSRSDSGSQYLNTFHSGIVIHAQEMDSSLCQNLKENSRSLSNVTYIDTDDLSTSKTAASCSSWNNHFESCDKNTGNEEEIILTVLNNYWQIEREGRQGERAGSFCELNFDFSDTVRNTRSEPFLTNSTTGESNNTAKSFGVLGEPGTKTGQTNKGFVEQESQF